MNKTADLHGERIILMVLLYTMLEGFDFASTPEGGLAVTNKEISPDPLGEIYLVALSSEKPEETMPVKIRLVRQEGAGLSFVAESAIFSIEGRITSIPKSPHFQFKLRITNRAAPGAYSLSIYFKTPARGTPRFLVPGIFYKHNRSASCQRVYPAFSLHPTEQDDPFVSNYWSFRSDRAAEPAIFGWNDDLSFVLATQSVFAKGQTGLYLKADEENIRIGLHFPYREEPVKYSFCHDSGNTPEFTFFYLKRGEDLELSFDFGLDRRDLHFYAPFLRRVYERDHQTAPTNPWVDADYACQVLAEGLYRWHYDKKESALWETCAFDKYFGKKNSYVDRFSMHTAWVSGIPAASALLLQGRLAKKEEIINAGLSVLDKIATNLAPLGTFYPCWVSEKGWTGGWNPSENLAQARTAAEATLFLLRAVRQELQLGFVHQEWADAVKKSLDFATRIQREDGNFGAYYQIESGEVVEWEGAGGLLWIAALAGASVFFDEKEYLEAALKAADYYASFLEDEYLFGAPEDVHLTPTSEDGYNALISYLHLAEIARDPRWLHLAAQAADWLLTFRFSYNSLFPEHSILAAYDFHTKGGDVASPSNQHLHSYGLVCHPELMRLGRYLDDHYYIDRALDHLEFCHQFIARDHDDFGARRGMAPEQFYHTDWWQPKGHLLALSHTWCAGLILYADLWEKTVLGHSSIRFEKQPEKPAEPPPRRPRVPFSHTPTEELPPSERDTLYDF